MHPVLALEVVQDVEKGTTLCPQTRRHLGQHQRGTDAVLVAHLVGVDAVAERLLVPVAQPSHPRDPLEPGQGLLVPDPRVASHGRQQSGGHDRTGENGVGANSTRQNMSTEQ